MGTGIVILGSIAIRKALPNIAAGVADIPDEVVEAVAMD